MANPNDYLDSLATWLAQSRAKQEQLDAVNERNRLAGAGALPVGQFSGTPARAASQPFQGGLTGQGGYATPEERDSGKTYLPYDSRNAPGYRPGISSKTPEAIAADDRAFAERSAMWDADENRKNAEQDARLLQAGQQLPSPTPGREYEDTTRAYTLYNQQKQDAQTADWKKYQDIMAKGDATPRFAGNNSPALPATNGQGYTTPTTEPIGAGPALFQFLMQHLGANF